MEFDFFSNFFGVQTVIKWLLQWLADVALTVHRMSNNIVPHNYRLAQLATIDSLGGTDCTDSNAINTGHRLEAARPASSAPVGGPRRGLYRHPLKPA
jgi:hypothetical protein